MKNVNKHRVAVAVAALVGVTVSASLYARYQDHLVLPEHRALNGAMCEELKDSSANKDMKAEYEAALEAQKQARVDLIDKQAAVKAQRKLLLQAQAHQQKITTECATAAREQQQAEADAQRQAALDAAREQQARAQAERTANIEAQRKAAAEAQQKAMEEAQKRQAEWQTAMASQQQAVQEAQRKAAEEAQKRIAEQQAARVAQQQAVQKAQRKAAEEAQKHVAEQQAAMAAQQQAVQEAQRKAAEEAQKRVAEQQADMAAQQQSEQDAQRKAAEEAQKRAAEQQAQWQAMADSQRAAAAEAMEQQAQQRQEWQNNTATAGQNPYAHPFSAAGYPTGPFSEPFNAPQPLARGEIPAPDWDFIPDQSGFFDNGYPDVRKEMFDSRQRRRNARKHRLMNERPDAYRRDMPFRTAGYYGMDNDAITQMCETFNKQRD